MRNFLKKEFFKSQNKLCFVGVLFFCVCFMACTVATTKFSGTMQRKARSIDFDKKITLSNIDSLPLAKKKLKEALQTLQYNPSKDHLVLIIHGRGRHPQKAYRKILPFVEGQYKVKTLLFHWPGSWSGVAGFPQEKAFAAKDSFRYVIQALKAYKKSHKKMRSCVLFTHSMGSLVLEAYTRKFHREFPPHLFDNILIDASASALHGHKNWVSKIRCKKKVYITFNDNDVMLQLAGVYGSRLGKNLKSLFEGINNLAEKACYIDFSNTCVGGGGHKYYIAKYQCGSLNIHKFYQCIFQGKTVDLKDANCFHNTKNNVYKILTN